MVRGIVVFGPLPAIRAVLAGCPRALERRIGRFLDDRAPVAVKRAFARGQPRVRLSFQRGRSRLFLLVEPRTFAPVAVRIGRRGTGWSWLAPAGPRPLALLEFRSSHGLRVIVEENA